MLTSQPQSRTVLTGGSAIFAVEATGAGDLLYQWRFNGAGSDGATNSSYILTHAEPAEQGNYSVRVTDGGTVSSSRDAFLRVLPGAVPSRVVGWAYDNAGETTWPPGLTNGVLISAGQDFSLCVTERRHGLWLGRNSYGQTSVPEGLTNVVHLSAGYAHSLAVKADGTVVGWGITDNGVSTAPIGLSNVIAVAGGYVHSLALKSDGTVVGWGAGAFGQQTPPEGLSHVVAIAAAIEHSLALRADGIVVGWGAPDGRATPPSGLSGVVAIAAGHSHSLALKNDGTVVGWGWGEAALPADLSNESCLSPDPLPQHGPEK